MVVLFYSPTSTHFLQILTLDMMSLFNYIHVERCVVVSHCGLIHCFSRG